MSEENSKAKKDKPVYDGNSIMVRPNGPLICMGDTAITLLDTDERLILKDKEFALCRCGLSKNKPFCDGTHKKEGAVITQLFTDERKEAIDDVNDSLTIKVKKNAMYIIQGPVTIFSRDGLSETTRTKAALCRCGQSDEKPFCDRKHKKCEFSDE